MATADDEAQALFRVNTVLQLIEDEGGTLTEKDRDTARRLLAPVVAEIDRLRAVARLHAWSAI